MCATTVICTFLATYACFIVREKHNCVHSFRVLSAGDCMQYIVLICLPYKMLSKTNADIVTEDCAAVYPCIVAPKAID